MLKRMPLRRHEQIAVFYKKLPVYNPQYTEGIPLHSKGKSYKSKEPKNQNYGKLYNTDDERSGSTEKYPTSILSFLKPHPSKSIHPTQKPVDLCEHLIKTYSREHDLILDNCMGSGTTAIACLNCSRDYIGFEKDKDIYEVA